MFFKNRWPLLLILVIFISFKVPHLFYPYYWDESTMFAPGCIAMYLHGPSVMPGAIDISFAHGHPLFFFAAFAVWINIFGHSYFAMHCFALLISLLLIMLVYEAGLKFFTPKTAIISVLLLILYPPFFVQSSFVLPDIMIALLFFSGIYFYASRKYILTALCLTMLCYTKESAIVLAIILFIDALRFLFNKNVAIKQRLFACASVFVPVILGLLFYIIQKHNKGWYIAPLARSSHPDFTLGNASYWLRFCLDLMFRLNNRYIFFLFLLLLSLAATIKQRSVKYAFLLLPAILLYFLNIDHSYGVNYEIALLVVFICLVSLSVYFLGYNKKDNRQKFIVLITVFFIAYLYYLAIFDFQLRYIFPEMVVLSFLAAVFFDFFIARLHPAVFYLTLIFLLCTGTYNIMQERGDGELGVFDAMKVQQSVVDYCEEHDLYHKIISAGSYQDVLHLKDPNSGYLHSNKTFDTVIFGKYTLQTKYAIFESVEIGNYYVGDTSYYEQCKSDSTFHLVYRNKIGKKWAEIYARE